MLDGQWSILRRRLHHLLPLTNEAVPPPTNIWTELRWWLLAATVFTVFAAISVYLLQSMQLSWRASFRPLFALPFVAEAFIQFRSRWRRLLWIFTGILTIILIDNYLTLRSPRSPPSYFSDLPVWIRGPITFLPSAILEFLTASRARKRPWIWLIVTPLLFGLMFYWMIPAQYLVHEVLVFIEARGVLTGPPMSQLYFATAPFGLILFTRALTGSLIASRKLAQ
jgi:hypothetical protein